MSNGVMSWESIREVGNDLIDKHYPIEKEGRGRALAFYADLVTLIYEKFGKNKVDSDLRDVVKSLLPEVKYALEMVQMTDQDPSIVEMLKMKIAEAESSIGPMKEKRRCDCAENGGYSGSMDCCPHCGDC